MEKKECRGCGSSTFRNNHCVYCGNEQEKSKVPVESEMEIFTGNMQDLQVSNSKIIGNQNTIKGNGNIIIGNMNDVYGDNNLITGNMNDSVGKGNKSKGNMNDNRLK